MEQEMTKKANVAAKPRIKTKELTLMGLFTALIAVGAFIKVPLPMMDFFTLQTFFVVLSGMLLGPRLGTGAVLAYLVLGLAGMPIFAAGGGIGYVLRPSFGYLLGFAVSAYMAGKLTENKPTYTAKNYALIGAVSLVPTYILGYIYKYMIMNFYTGDITSLWAIVAATLTVDVPGDLILCAIAGLLVKRTKNALRLYM